MPPKTCLRCSINLESAPAKALASALVATFRFIWPRSNWNASRRWSSSAPLLTFPPSSGHHEPVWEILRRRHPGGDAQIKAVLASTKCLATSYDALNFTPPLLSTIQARTLIIQGDGDPLYPRRTLRRKGQSHSALSPLDRPQRGPRPGHRSPLARVPPNGLGLPAGIDFSPCRDGL